MKLCTYRYLMIFLRFECTVGARMYSSLYGVELTCLLTVVYLWSLWSSDFPGNPGDMLPVTLNRGFSHIPSGLC